MKLPRVVIVGAGFGGLAAAKALAGAPIAVTIVDQHNFHTFSPLLYQVATAGLAPDDIAPNLRGIVQSDLNVEARMATVHGIDFDRREVLVDRGVSIPYDYLILAVGAVSSDFGVPGVAEHAIPLKTLADATRIRSTVLSRFEAANTNPSLLDDGTLPSWSRVAARPASNSAARSASYSRRCSRRTSRTSMLGERRSSWWR
jgi:NADH dehydrogenase